MSVTNSIASSPYCIPVTQDYSCLNAAYSILQSAARPLGTLYYGAMNAMYTGHWLTSSQVLSNVQIRMGISSLESLQKEIQSLPNNTHISIHTGCKRYVKHSTVLTIGKDKIGNYYAFFFDPQGRSPSEAFLIDKELLVTDEGSGFKTIETAEDLYQKLVDPLNAPPPLKYNACLTQWDWNTCVAHSAVFLEALETEEKTDWNPDAFMERVANHQVVTLTKVHHKMLELYKTIDKERALLTTGDPFTFFESEIDDDLPRTVCEEDPMDLSKNSDWILLGEPVLEQPIPKTNPSSSWSMWAPLETIKNCLKFLS